MNLFNVFPFTATRLLKLHVNLYIANELAWRRSRIACFHRYVYVPNKNFKKERVHFVRNFAV